MNETRIPAIPVTGLYGAVVKVGYLNATARMNVALGIRSDGLADACGLAPLATRASSGVASQA